jgi:multidrug resistance efflux pump
MEILFTIAYIFLIWLIHHFFKRFKLTLWVVIFYCALYAAAILLDVVVLGQITPYSSKTSVDSVVLQLQPKWSGYVEKVHVKSNTPIKKGDPILTMDTTQWIDKLNKQKAELVNALKRYKDALELTPSGAMRQEDLLFRKSDVDRIQAEVNLAEYNLKHAVTYAPENGYVPILFIKPGMYLSLFNRNAIPFICTDQLWIVAELKQQSVHCVQPGDFVEVALAMYPGKILYGKVVDMIWAQGNVQFFASSKMPTTNSFQPSNMFFIKIELNKGQDKPLRFGASGKLVIYTKEAPGISIAIRRIEIRCDSLLYYIYNPFS